MPVCASFDDAPSSEFPKFDFVDDDDCFTTAGFGMYSSDCKVAADWFGPLYDSHPSKSLFGGLDPKRPNYCPIPAGAVFDREDRCHNSGLASLDARCGFASSSGYSALEFKEKNPDTKQPVVDSKFPHLQGKANERLELKEVYKTNKSLNVEKKKRGRPRLELVQARQQQQRRNLPVFDLQNFNLSAYALKDRPSALYNYNEDNVITVGCYTKAVRRGKIERFKAKKLRTLQYGPFERYGFRKQFAGMRPRVGGRFIKMDITPPPSPEPSHPLKDEDTEMGRPFRDCETGMLIFPQDQLLYEDFPNFCSPFPPELEPWATA
jgi:hypothetical protein